jgi:hypothetical protein
MFPTFISFTNRHPRYVAVVGFSIFILGVVLLGYAYLSTQQLEVADVSTQVEVEDQKDVEISFEEKMAILDSLKNSDADATTDEEKMKILESLAPAEESTVSTEEKMKILESLKSE